MSQQNEKIAENQSHKEAETRSRDGTTTAVSSETGMAVALIARIIGWSLLATGLGVGLGVALFARHPGCGSISLLPACVRGTVGAIAGAAREIVAALRQRPPD